MPRILPNTCDPTVIITDKIAAFVKLTGENILELSSRNGGEGD